MKYHVEGGCTRNYSSARLTAAQFYITLSSQRCAVCSRMVADPAAEKAAKIAAGHWHAPQNHPFVGTRRRFTYPIWALPPTPESHPEYAAHTGQLVTVTRQLRDDECDPECQPMLEFRADDGFVGIAHASELDGTVRPLRPQDYQFAVPPGTGDRYLSDAEIDAAIDARDAPETRIG